MYLYNHFQRFSCRPLRIALFFFLGLALAKADFRSVTFGDPAASTGWVDNGVVSANSTSETFTFSDSTPSGTVDFALTIQGSHNIRSNNDQLHIDGGLGGTVIDSRDWSDSGDDEWMEFTLSITGAGASSVKNLSLGGVQLLFANDNDLVRYSDASASNDILNPANDVNAYHKGSLTALDGLNPLTVKTVGGIGDGSWSLSVEAQASGTTSDQIPTRFRVDNLTLNYRIEDSVTRVGDVLGVAHTGGKYTLYGPGASNPENYLNEGASLIETAGSKVVKVFMGKSYADPHFPWNSDWPVVNSALELAETPHFREFFSRPALTTYVLDVTEFSQVFWKDGMSATEIQDSYDEIYDLAAHFLATYSNKVFIIQNWEGDNAFGSPSNVTLAEQGMIDWLNTRQSAVDQARLDVPSTSQVWGAAEFNKLPLPYALNQPSHLIIDTVLPFTNMDLYSMSNYLTWRNDGREDLIFEMLDYIEGKCPDSSAFGSKNIFFGEYGSKENVLGDLFPALDKTVLQRQMAGRQLEQSLKWGVKYIIYWATYDNRLRNGITLAPGQEATNDQLLGNWLIRPDDTFTQLFDYYSSITIEPLDNYANVYELENSEPTSLSGDTVDLVEASLQSSGGFYYEFNADASSDEFKVTLFVPEAGTYSIEVAYRTGTDTGILRLFVGGVALGNEIDTYSTSPSYQSSDIGVTKTFAASGSKDFKFRSKSKNAASSGFKLNLDYVKLVKQ